MYLSKNFYIWKHWALLNIIWSEISIDYTLFCYRIKGFDVKQYVDIILSFFTFYTQFNHFNFYRPPVLFNEHNGFNQLILFYND